ncbi:hypothetical protein RP20_CCG002779 [Aedes albopictus]|nr:hypothetical protein RP20_CCG002779 [Aedes albopictus]
MDITLIVKASNQQFDDQTIKCEPSWTIRRLKGHLTEVYPGKPARRYSMPKEVKEISFTKRSWTDRESNRHPQHGHAEYPCVYRLGYMGPSIINFQNFIWKNLENSGNFILSYE